MLELATVTVRHKDTPCYLLLLIVQGDGANLQGGNWFASLSIGLAGMLNKFRSVFEADLTGRMASLSTRNC